MKSILQEASSIERAIDKAWNEAGKPKEFTIKILDQGERNFLGLTRRPAIVSILYKPEKSTYHQPRARRDSRDSRDSRERSSSTGRRNDRSRRGDGVRTRSDRSNNGYERTNRESVRNERAERSEHSERSDCPERSERSERSERFERRTESPRRNEEMNAWHDEWKQSVTNNLSQMLQDMDVKTGFDTAITDHRVLTITFKSAVLQDEEEQRMLFASLSYLSIQFLKREYKNRFTGFRIVVTGQASSALKKRAEGQGSEKRERSERPSRSTSRRDDKPRSSRGRRPKETAASVDDTSHIDEQLKFAKQQLEGDGDLANVLEQVTADKHDEKASSKKSASPARKAASSEKKKVKAESKPSEPAAKTERAGAKKKVKHQPFFVLPDEHEKEDDA